MAIVRGRRVAAAVGAPVVVAAVVAVALNASSGAGPEHRPAPRQADRVVVGRTLYVESEVSSTRFLPLGRAPADGRTLSAQRAYNAMLQGPSAASLLPAGVDAYYGVLIQRFVPAVGTHVRVWGFAVESGCAYTTGPTRAGDPTPSRPTRCRKWEFVNARTGHDLGVITQEILPD